MSKKTIKKTFEIEINKDDLELLEEYGFYFERNFEDMCKDVAQQIRVELLKEQR